MNAHPPAPRHAAASRHAATRAAAPDVAAGPVQPVSVPADALTPARSVLGRRAVRSSLALLAVLSTGALGLVVASQGSGAAATKTVRVVIAKDSFARQVGSGLGRAEIGGTWSVRAARGATTQVRPHTGSSQIVVNPGTSTTASLPQVSGDDTTVQTTFTVPNTAAVGNGLFHTLRVRVQPDGSAYGGRVTVRAGGVMSVSLMKYVRGAESSLGLTMLSHRVASGQSLHLEFAVSGDSPVALSVRAWAAGAAPGWQLTRSDSSATRITRAGAVGFADYLSGTARKPVVVAVADISATALRTVPVNSPTPAPPAPTPPASTSPPSTPPAATPPTASPAPTSSAPTSSAPAAPPAEQTPAAAQPFRGSFPVGQARYAVPARSLFVDPSGSDTASGTEAAPLRTLARAITLSGDGTTIVLRGGLYHESVQINNRPGITIQAYPGEQVWLDGTSVVDNWQSDGSRWVSRGWTNQFDHGASFVRGSDAGGFVNPNFPMAPHPDQVFVDGLGLKQVASPSAVTAGTFAVDYDAKTLTIGTDPTGKSVRASDLARAIVVNSSNVTLRGFGVRGYGNSLPTGPAVYFGASKDSLVENVVFTDIATQALGSSRSNLHVDHVSAQRIGMLSISGTQADGMVVENSFVTKSNSERFNREPSAGAIKITRSRGITIRNNDLSNNYDANGLWLDESVVGFTVVKNTASDNGTGAGIETELSDTGVVADNELMGGDKGLFIFDTANVKVFNNHFGRNSRGSVFIMQDSRRESTPGPNHDPRQPIPDPACTWVVKNIQVSNNVFDWNGGAYGFQFYALDGQTNISADAMDIVLNGNQFHVRGGSTDTMVGWGGSDNKTLTKIHTPGDLNTALNKQWTNTQIDAQARTQNAPLSPAIPLPSDVARALGQNEGVRHLGTFF